MDFKNLEAITIKKGGEKGMPLSILSSDKMGRVKNKMLQSPVKSVLKINLSYAIAHKAEKKMNLI